MLSLYIVLPYYPNVTLLPQCYPYTLCYPITPMLPYYPHVILIDYCVTLLPRFVTLLHQCYSYTLGGFTSTGVTGYKGIRVTFYNVFKWRKVILIPLYPVTPVLVKYPYCVTLLPRFVILLPQCYSYTLCYSITPLCYPITPMLSLYIRGIHERRGNGV